MRKKLIICVIAASLFHTNIYASKFRFILNSQIKQAVSTSAESQTEEIYCDTKGLWCASSAARLYTDGIFEGIKIGEKRYFQPDVQITRGDFLLYLETVTNVKQTNLKSAPFEDFPLIPVWQKNTVLNMYDAGIIHGAVESGKLYCNPDEYISRLEAAQIIANAFSLKAQSKDGSKYSDSYLIPKYSADAVCAVTENNIMNGYTDNSFRPYVKITRGMLADILCRIRDFEIIIKK